MRKQLLTLITLVSLSGHTFADDFSKKLMPIFCFQQFSDKPVKERLKLPTNNPAYFGLNYDHDHPVWRSFYITDELTNDIIQDVLKRNAYKSATGFVPTHLKETCKRLEENGYVKYQDGEDDRCSLMGQQLPTDIIYKIPLTLRLNSVKKTYKEKNNIIVKRATTKEEQKIWIQIASQAFEGLFACSEKEMALWVDYVLKNSNNGKNVFFYTGFLNNEPVAVVQTTHYTVDGVKIAHSQWGGTIKKYRQNKVLKAILAQGILDALERNISHYSAVALPGISKNACKELGFEAVKGGECYLYHYDFKIPKKLSIDIKKNENQTSIFNSFLDYFSSFNPFKSETPKE